jgi:hypothetical protein
LMKIVFSTLRLIGGCEVLEAASLLGDLFD